MNYWIGTSGFQYAEWKGTFYPEDLSTAKMLPFYAERFSTTEVNYSFRRIPSAKTIQGWYEATPGRFKFSLKAPQKVTHFAKLKNCGDTMRYFCQVICDLETKLGPVLFQLPPNLKKDGALLADFLAEVPAGLRAAFEFRNPSWFDEEVFAILSSKNIALCIADSAELTTPVVATADYGYLRLRREDYSDADMERWAGVIRQNDKVWPDAFVYLKHEESGMGPRLAKQLGDLLGGTAAVPSLSSDA
ncbi:MAG TPA: DUF72 domain-containing protein [Chthoniobacterales bacterium]|jgi:uncharacterized protein YecE (DUF72 family)|nr:DUF72 domain-containing protein [Chthoniobacterales bacterium]